MNKYKTIIISSVFIALEIILGILIQFTSSYLNVIFSYASVVLATAFPLFFMKSKNYIFIQIGLLFTTLADLFLVVITPMLQIPAMICFSITQLCYFSRLYFNQSSQRAKTMHLIIRCFFSILIIIITFIILKEKFNKKERDLEDVYDSVYTSKTDISRELDKIAISDEDMDIIDDNMILEDEESLLTDAAIAEELEKMALAIDSLNLWIDNTIATGKLNKELLSD